MNAKYFSPLRKPHARSDQIIAYSRDLFEELEVDMATIKTIEAFVVKYNILNPGKTVLNEETFRNAFFTCRAFEEGQKLGILPSNTLLFTKRQIGADSEFERYLEDITQPLSISFSKRWCQHREISCGVEHKVVVFDGHAKLHTDCCQNRNSTLVSHDALDKPVSLACGRWPLHVHGTKLPLCGSCMKTNLAIHIDIYPLDSRP